MREAPILNATLAGLAFLVLAFGYRLLGGSTPSIPVLLAVGVLVALATAAGTWAVSKRRV